MARSRSGIALLKGTPAKQRFALQVEVGDGCWTWLGSRTQQGYGRLMIETKVVAAHCAAWRMFRGPIPIGMYVCHHCDNPSCVKPSHLFLGTPKDNIQDCALKGRLPRSGAIVCPRGHPYGHQAIRNSRSPDHMENRVCRICVRDRYRQTSQYKGGKYTCGRCGSPGHRRTTCERIQRDEWLQMDEQ